MISSKLFGEGAAMAQIIVRDLEEDVKQRIKRRAQRHGRSMEDEIRHILRDAAKQPAKSLGGLGTRVAALFHETGFGLEVPEVRGHPATPAKFDE
jgi:plasmid stability protein